VRCKTVDCQHANPECVGAAPNLDVRRATFQSALDALLAETQPDLRNVALVRVLELIFVRQIRFMSRMLRVQRAGRSGHRISIWTIPKDTAAAASLS